MKYLTAVLLILLTGCAIRATENDVSRWHGYLASERVQSAEKQPQNRCYAHPREEVRCFDLNAETDVNYEVGGKP
jgi:hypothetical protein